VRVVRKRAKAGRRKRQPAQPHRETVNDLLARMTRYLDLFQALAEAAKALTGNLRLDDVLQAILRAVTQLLGPENWSLLLLDPERNELYFEIAVGQAAPAMRDIRLKLGEGIAGWVAEHRQPLVVPAVADDARFSSRVDQATHFATESIVCVPMMFQDRLLGVIELVGAKGSRQFSDEDLAVLTPFADFAAIAIGNARAFQRVEELTLIDEWTGLFNARFLRQRVSEEVDRAHRYHHPVSLIFFDLDYFKRINDQFGHGRGSGVLKQVGEVLKATIRSSDRPVRYGGDEFVIILPETDKPSALKIAERAREGLGRHCFGEGVDQVTASFGVATFPDDARDCASLLEVCDRAMYLGKARGRDQVVDANMLGPASEST
jgi:diguanylate cyclase (GGDEF)-like protein